MSADLWLLEDSFSAQTPSNPVIENGPTIHDPDFGPANERRQALSRVGDGFATIL
jgi:hypothetical protein